MSESRSMLQVYFEDPFWVGLFQRWEGGCLHVSKVTFGAQPREQEVYQFILTRYTTLSFGPPVADKTPERSAGPKRRQRQARELMSQHSPSTKSQQALQLQRQTEKSARQVRTRQAKLAREELRFAKKQQKKKARRRGH